MIGLLAALGRRRRRDVVLECRRCGTDASGSTERCPTCGGTGFAAYEIGG